MKRTGLKKGTKITSEPIRKQKDLKAISRLLKSRPRDFLLWTLGINNGLPQMIIFFHPGKAKGIFPARAWAE